MEAAQVVLSVLRQTKMFGILEKQLLIQISCSARGLFKSYSYFISYTYRVQVSDLYNIILEKSSPKTIL